MSHKSLSSSSESELSLNSIESFEETNKEGSGTKLSLGTSDEIVGPSVIDFLPPTSPGLMHQSSNPTPMPKPMYEEEDGDEKKEEDPGLYPLL